MKWFRLSLLSLLYN